MSRFPHLAQSRPTSIHQENEEHNDILTEPPSARIHSGKHSRRSISGNIVGPSLSPLTNYDVPLLHSLRPRDMKSSVADWIKLQNEKEQHTTSRLHSNVLRSASGSVLQLKTANSPSFVATSPLPESLNRDEILPLSERGIIEDYEEEEDDDDDGDDDDEDDDNDLYVDSSADIVPSDDDSLNLNAPPLMALSGTASPHVLKIVGPSTDEVTINGLATAASQLDLLDQCDLADDFDEYEDESFDQRYSVLNPHQAYVEVEPLNYGSPLAPEGTPLDLSKVQPCVHAFPFVHEPLISPDELKLLALWDYELKQVGATGLDIQECLPGLDLDQIEKGETRTCDDYDDCHDDDHKKKKNLMSWFFNPASAEKRYAKKNPWYRILHLIDEYSLFSSTTPPSSRDDNDDGLGADKTGPLNRDMIPIGYTSQFNLGIGNKQVAKLIPT